MSDAMDAIVTIEHLSHCYESGMHQTWALRDVSLEIARGSCTAIIGFNGSGKSTLIQHFNGLLRPSEGRIVVDGINVGARGTDLRLLRQRVGLLFQFPESQLFERTVFADVAFGPRRMHLGRNEVRARVLAALDLVGLPHADYGWRSPFELSGGQRRRVALAGVLAMSPTVLILDEPTVGLDGEGRAEFYAYLRKAQCEQGLTIILVTHDMSEVAAMAEHLFVLYQGRLVSQGSPREIFAQREALHAWGLAVPPLHELLHAFREQGIPIPTDVLTLDEAFAFLLAQRRCFPGTISSTGAYNI